MIILLHGNNIEKSRKKLQEIIASQTKKNPEATHYRVEPDTFDESVFQEFIGGNGLFQNSFIVVCDGLFTAKQTSEKLFEYVKMMKESNNVFISIEGVLTKELLKKIEKYAEKVQESIDIKKENKKDTFNVFALTDALGNRNKKQLWVLYQEALMHGSEPEELHRLFLWQIKAMLASSISEAQDSGQNPFVFKKGQRFSKNYSLEELQKKSFELVELYHEVRRGEGEFDTALERFVLSL